MEHLRKFNSQVRSRLFVLLLIDNIVFLADYWIVEHVVHLDGITLILALAVVPFLALTILPWLSTRYLVQPTKLISEAILHIAPDAVGDVPSPNPASAHFGKELVASLTHQVYQLATIADRAKLQPTTSANFNADFIANNLPLPLLVLDDKQMITMANEACAQYLQLDVSDIVGKNLYSVLDMSFISKDTFDSWLASVQGKAATAIQSWERVRLNPVTGRDLKLFDLAAYYNQGNLHQLETMLVLFDHTARYSQDDQAISFIALSVHELRTPLTLLRGYIEAFEDELNGKLDPQLNDFMFKMSATAQQLMTFVNNILNVARVDGDQLVLQLHEEAWDKVIRSAANNLALRAKVRGITLEYSIEPNLPTVGADRVSIIEVINNLVDNAIKYSGKSERIRITARKNSDGMVETIIEDFGVGIPPNILPKLFLKFYRDHHNRSQVGGTGLGLYLSKSIVDAHGGTIWVKSKLGEGSSFGFTLVPYAQLANELKNGNKEGIVRGAHGWIKNHSLYRD
jgi:signal transduction histidine kinase